jgi:hypothetical protein
MSDIRTLQVAGSGTISNENVSFIRSEDRERREQEERARLNPQQDLTPAQRLGQAYAAIHKAEEDRKQKERARLIAEGKIVLDPITRIETHRMRGNQY